MNKVAALAVLLVLLTACGGSTTSTASQPTDTATSTEPAGLSIPTIGVNVDKLDTFGLDNKGNYECPVDPKSAAWNRDGTAPGEPGLALIVAPAQGVFQRLSELKPGALVYISRVGGTKLTFKTVDATTPTGSSELQLAACGEGRSTAVYAELTSP